MSVSTIHPEVLDAAFLDYFPVARSEIESVLDEPIARSAWRGITLAWTTSVILFLVLVV